MPPRPPPFPSLLPSYLARSNHRCCLDAPRSAQYAPRIISVVLLPPCRDLKARIDWMLLTTSQALYRIVEATQPTTNAPRAFRRRSHPLFCVSVRSLPRLPFRSSGLSVPIRSVSASCPFLFVPFLHRRSRLEEHAGRGVLPSRAPPPPPPPASHMEPLSSKLSRCIRPCCPGGESRSPSPPTHPHPLPKQVREQIHSDLYGRGY